MRENFLILNFSDDLLEISALKVDFANKDIRVLYTEKSEPEAKNKLKNFFLNSFRFRSYKVILILSPKTAVTNYETVSLTRDKPNNPIGQSDLENLISQALWKIFDKGRRISAKQFGLSDIEILLMDSRIHDMRIDGRRVIEPLRHSGRKIQIDLSQTFINRPFLREIISILPKRAKLVLAIESGISANQLISRMINKNPKANSPPKDGKIIFARVGDNKTDLFGIGESENRQIVFRGHFGWGKNQFYKAMARDLKVDYKLAESIVSRLVAGETSFGFNRRFYELFSKEIAPLIKGLKSVASRLKNNSLYLYFPDIDSALIWGKIFPKMILSINSHQTMGVFGFKCQTNLDFSTLTALLTYYFLPREDLLNHLARRRMRWLMAQ